MRGGGEGRYRAALILACMLVCHRRIRLGIQKSIWPLLRCCEKPIVSLAPVAERKIPLRPLRVQELVANGQTTTGHTWTYR